MITSEQAVSYGTLIALVVTTVMSQVASWRTKQRDQAVSDKLDASDATRNQKLDVIHSLVNSGMATQLHKVVDLAQQVFALTQTPEARQAMELARATFDAHMVRQAVIDRAAAVGVPLGPCPDECPYIAQRKALDSPAVNQNTNPKV